MAVHKTVKVVVGDCNADIDEEIAALITEIWRADIDTLNSCQESRPGIAWIDFADAHSAAEFIDIVTGPIRDETNVMYNHITKWNPWAGTTKGLWEYDTRLVDYPGFSEDVPVEERDIDEAGDGRRVSPPHSVFAVSIRFPREDLPVLLERMQRHNSDQGDKPPQESLRSEAGTGVSPANTGDTE